MKRLLTLCLVAALVAAIAPAALADGDDLAARYHLNGDAFDSSDNENHGSVFGDTGFVRGRFGRAADFDGDGDYISVADGAGLSDLDGFSELTLEAWINLASTSAAPRGIIAKYNTNSAYVSYYLGLSNDELRILVAKQPGSYAYATTIAADLAPGSWYHVAGTWDGASLKLFVNGVDEPVVLIGTVPDAMYDSSVPVNIGDFGFNASGTRFGFFDGMIDEARIWSCALTSGEIAKHAKSNSSASSKC